MLHEEKADDITGNKDTRERGVFKFVGDLPTDSGKFWKYLLGIGLGIGAGLYGIAYLLFNMGVL